MQARFAGALVFVASGSVLVLEILAGRLLAPYVGVSLETFTGVIGVVLAGIAVGTWAGGWLADRIDPRTLLPVALTVGGGAAIAALPIVRALGPAADGGHPLSIVVLAGAAFFAPAALLSAVSPLTVKVQLRDVAHTGAVVGRIAALGTVGSLVGVFGTGYLLVAEVPSTPIVLTLGGLLVITGVVLWVTRPSGGRGPLVAAGAALAVVGGGAAVLAGRPCDVETAYFCARVEVAADRPSARILWLDDLRHAYVDLADPTHLEFSYTKLLGAVIDTMAPPGQPIDAVHIGGGGFTIPRYVAATRPGSDDLVLELDPGVVRVAEDAMRRRSAGAYEQGRPGQGVNRTLSFPPVPPGSRCDRIQAGSAAAMTGPCPHPADQDASRWLEQQTQPLSRFDERRSVERRWYSAGLTPNPGPA